MSEEFDWLNNSYLLRRDCTPWSYLGIRDKQRSDRIKGCRKLNPVRERMKEIWARTLFTPASGFQGNVLA
jgi:hypothetical protein